MGMKLQNDAAIRWMVKNGLADAEHARFLRREMARGALLECEVFDEQSDFDARLKQEHRFARQMAVRVNKGPLLL